MCMAKLSISAGTLDRKHWPAPDEQLALQCVSMCESVVKPLRDFINLHLVMLVFILIFLQNRHFTD